MTRISFTLVCSAIALATALSGQARPRVVWLNPTHDFGAFNEETGKAKCLFKGINTGDEPLVVLSVRTNCGCTASSVSARTIAPGDTVTVSATYDAIGRPGHFIKRVYVETNADPARSVLSIEGTVIGSEKTVRTRYPLSAGPLRLRSDIVMFGSVNKGRSKMAFIDGYNMTADSIRPSFIDLPKQYNIKCAPAVVPPGERVSMSVYYDSYKSDDWGFTSDTLSLVPDRGAAPYPITTTIILAEDFSKLTPGQRMNAPHASLSTVKIDLGQLHREDKKEASFSIKNTGKDPLLIRKLSTSDKSITLSIDKTKIKKGRKATVRVVIDTSKALGDILNSKVTIITNDPDSPQRIVRVVGLFK